MNSELSFEMDSCLPMDFSDADEKLDDFFNFPEIEQTEGELEQEIGEVEDNMDEKTESIEQNKRNSLPSSAMETLCVDSSPITELGLSFPEDIDVAQLEWVSRIMDDSQFLEDTVKPLPKLPVLPKPDTKKMCLLNSWPESVKVKRSKRYRTVYTDYDFVQAKRNKKLRSRDEVWSVSDPPSFTDSNNSSSTTTNTITTTSTISSSSSSSYSSYLIPDYTPNYLLLSKNSPSFNKFSLKPKKRGRKPKSALPDSSSSVIREERRCSHCGVSKTPQWRAGPNGSKTLCNACGVRYKSGRLLPEYRPACSPTFVSHVHSNSHRKVLEMRRKKEEEVVFVPSPLQVISY